MKICVITTYPESGSKNIGDALITRCTKSFLYETFGDQVEVVSVWRADNWKNVKDIVESSDVVVFACLAIRKFMTTLEYPYLWEIINSGKKVAVLAAGTDLSVGLGSLDLASSVSKDTKDALKKLGEIACVFSSRGCLTHWLLKTLGIANDVFSGDIAFYDMRFMDRKFETVHNVKRIAVSDPHRGEVYWPTMNSLLTRLSELFPDADIEVLMHGVNPFVEKEVKRIGMKISRIYEHPETGLDQYDRFDLHVGFRVHGHVSALSRRIPSFLLEQDGRGSEYGLTINGRFGVPCHLSRDKSLFKRVVRKFKLPFDDNYKEDSEAIEKLSAVLLLSKESDFSNFLGLENELIKYVLNFRALASRLVN